jgi:hypothetical protein
MKSKIFPKMKGNHYKKQKLPFLPQYPISRTLPCCNILFMRQILSNILLLSLVTLPWKSFPFRASDANKHKRILLHAHEVHIELTEIHRSNS